MDNRENPSPLRPAPSRANSFRYAFAGVWYVLRTQPNARIHALILAAVIVVGIAVQLGSLEWAIITLIAALVWMAEFVNTAIETAVDLASPDLHPLAKVSKDVSAGAVLITAGAAVIIGVIILGPPLWILLARLLAT